MIYKNIEIHNVAQLIETEEGVTWRRVPKLVYDNLSRDAARKQAEGSTGVELRFVIESGDSATIRIKKTTKGNGVYTTHVFRGSIQGAWDDHEVNRTVGNDTTDIVIKKSTNMEMLHRMTKASGSEWNPCVIRLIFDRGCHTLVDVSGDVRPPKKEEMPSKTYLAYGSSITHGSNSIDASHSWVSTVAHNLDMDYRNLGFAGNCAMEQQMIDYIAKEGENGAWDIATLELGVNVLDWTDDKIYERVRYTADTIAGRNPEKQIFVISPFYMSDDFNNIGKAENWRKIIKEVTESVGFKNLHYINGLELLGDMSLVSADEVHPNIYGVEKIAQGLTKIIKESL